MSAGVGLTYRGGYEHDYPATSSAVNPFLTMNFEKTAFFPINVDGQYVMNCRVMTADETCMVPIQCMNSIEMASDSGADMILITREEADKLGYQVDMLSEDYNFAVQGISNEPSMFKEITTWIQIGNMRPIQAPVGLAVNTEALVQSLFGNKGTVDSGQVTTQYSSKGVLYMESMSNGASKMSII